MDTQDSHLKNINRIKKIKLLARGFILITTAMYVITYALLTTAAPTVTTSTETYLLQIILLSFAVLVVSLKWSLAGGILAVIWSSLIGPMLANNLFTSTASAAFVLGPLLLLIGGLLHIYVGLIENKNFFITKRKGKYKQVLISIIDRFKSKQWYYHNLIPSITVFTVIAIFSFTWGRTSFIWSDIWIRWNLNTYLWPTYNGEGLMPWEINTFEFHSRQITITGDIYPFIVTMFWWALLSLVIVIIGKFLLTSVQSKTHKTRPTTNTSH